MFPFIESSVFKRLLPGYLYNDTYFAQILDQLVETFPNG